MRRLIALLLLVLAGCEQTSPPAAYRNQRDQFFALLPMRFIDEDFYPCFRTIKGRETRLPDRECYVFGQPRRMHGIVHLFFKRAGDFYPGRSEPPLPSTPGQYWMTLEEPVVTAEMLAGCDHCYLHVDFIGRQTRVAGRHGHLGGSPHMIVIDQMLAARPVGQRQAAASPRA